MDKEYYDYDYYDDEMSIDEYIDVRKQDFNLQWESYVNEEPDKHEFFYIISSLL